MKIKAVKLLTIGMLSAFMVCCSPSDLFYLDQNNIFVEYKQFDDSHLLMAFGREKDSLRDTILVAYGRWETIHFKMFLSQYDDSTIYIQSDRQVIIHSKNNFNIVNSPEFVYRDENYIFSWIDPLLITNQSLHYSWQAYFRQIYVYDQDKKFRYKIDPL